MTIENALMALGTGFVGLIGKFVLDRISKLMDKIEENTKSNIELKAKVESVYVNAGLVPKLQNDTNEFYRRLNSHDKRLSILEGDDCGN